MNDTGTCLSTTATSVVVLNHPIKFYKEVGIANVNIPVEAPHLFGVEVNSNNPVCLLFMTVGAKCTRIAQRLTAAGSLLDNVIHMNGRPRSPTTIGLWRSV